MGKGGRHLDPALPEATPLVPMCLLTGSFCNGSSANRANTRHTAEERGAVGPAPAAPHTQDCLVAWAP